MHHGNVTCALTDCHILHHGAATKPLATKDERTVRKFLPKAAHIQAPLHEFLKNSKRNDKREVEWNAEAINAFNQCKNQLANVTLLAHPSQDADLALMTDASDFGLGASLNEITSHGFKPLGFFSKKLAPAQTKYSAFDHAFSRISAIVAPSTINYEEFAQMQQGDDELKALLSATNQTLQLKQLRMPGSTTEIYCDISTGTVRPYTCLMLSDGTSFLQCTTFRILEFVLLQS
ncbi:uncharacterized protein TNIN_470861 [Trichonephila inaurata madagascariensis]|uniref:Reverse transcriptase/retrotransposon-derived protein RNase H-like domain-containing protein n=1 Tax=Trichonephila inaurata madagascariensis TaxID=2747483 RepID=A0A8X6XGL7_9ARAC|nr:uncharacterized protein TNIN_470861 [Trichonephila inaurata madagascariensis]